MNKSTCNLTLIACYLGRILLVFLIIHDILALFCPNGTRFFLFCDPWDCLLDPPAVTVCQWTSEIRRKQPFNFSSVSQQLATCVESVFFILSLPVGSS